MKSGISSAIFYIYLFSDEVLSINFLSISLRFLCKGTAINTVTITESTSAIGCAYNIPFNPHMRSKINITGMKKFPDDRLRVQSPLRIF